MLGFSILLRELIIFVNTLFFFLFVILIFIMYETNKDKLDLGNILIACLDYYYYYYFVVNL